MKPPGTIWWDFDGTLVRRPYMWSEACCRCLEQIDPRHSVSQDRLRLALKGRFPWHRTGHADLNPPGWWQEVYRAFRDALHELGCSLPDGHGLDSAIQSDILDARRYALFDDVVPVLQELRDAGW